MIDTGRFEKPIVGARLMCIRTPPELELHEESSCCKPTQKLPNDIRGSHDSEDSHSTIDTLSDASDDHESASSAAESTSVECQAGSQGTLRANAPEFVPGVEVLANFGPSAFVGTDLKSDLAPQILATGPPLPPLPHMSGNQFATAGIGDGLWNCENCPADASLFLPASWDYHGEQPDMHSVADFLEEADRRMLEWRQYCGLTATLPESFPHSFDY
jgi:hypothetical protein